MWMAAKLPAKVELQGVFSFAKQSPGLSWQMPDSRTVFECTEHKSSFKKRLAVIPTQLKGCSGSDLTPSHASF